MSKSLTKADIIAHVAEQAGISRGSAQDAVDAFIGAIEKGLQAGGCRVAGLGTFSVRQRKAREGRNPQTGESIQIAESISVGFKAAKNLKDVARPAKGR